MAHVPTYQGSDHGCPAQIPNTENTENEDMCLRLHVDAGRYDPAQRAEGLQTDVIRTACLAAGARRRRQAGDGAAFPIESPGNARRRKPGRHAAERRRDDMPARVGLDRPTTAGLYQRIEGSATRRLGDLCRELALPSLDRLRIALICALQRLLWCKTKFGQDLTDGSHSKADAKLVINQIQRNTCYFCRDDNVRGRPVAGPDGSAFKPNPGVSASFGHLYILVRLKPQDAMTEAAGSPSRARSTAIKRMASSVL